MKLFCLYFAVLVSAGDNGVGDNGTASVIPAVPDHLGVVKVTTGQPVSLQCKVMPGNSVTWIQVEHPQTKFFYIYAKGKIDNVNARHRYLLANETNGDFTLTIKEAHSIDEGIYYCLQGNFTERPTQLHRTSHLRILKHYALYVTFKDFNRYVQIPAYVGDSVTLPCVTPLDKAVVWRYSGADYNIPYVYLDGNVDDSRSFRINDSMVKQYDLIIPDVQLNDSGVYICIEDGGIGRQHNYTLNVTERKMLVVEDYRSTHSTAILVEVLLVCAVLLSIVILAIVYYWRRRTKIMRRSMEKEQKQEKLQLLQTTRERERIEYYINADPRSVVESLRGEDVYGVTLLLEKLYVLRVFVDTKQVRYNSVDVYSTSNSWELLMRLQVTGQNLTDIASSTIHRCLFVCDSGARSILKLGLDGEITATLPLDELDEEPRAISVIPGSGNLLVTTSGMNSKLVEFKSESGRRLRVVELPVDVRSPTHAVQLPNGDFLVSHGGVGALEDPALHRVCLVGADDTGGCSIKRSFGGEGGRSDEQLQLPTRVAVDKDGFIFIADSWNDRIVLLSPSLKFLREIVDIGEAPARLIVDHVTRMKLRLYIGQDDRVAIFDL